MRNFRRMMWSAAAAALVSGSTASAQFQSGNSGTTGTGGFPTTQTQTTTNTNQSSASTTASGGLGTGSLSSGLEQNQNQFELAALKQAPSKTTTNNTAINTSNFLRNSYGSVYYQGSNPLQVPNRIPGSFGTAIYPATGTGGTAGGRGAQLGTAGGRGSGTLTDPGGQVVPLPRQIAYTSTIQFKSPNGNAMPQLQTDLLGAIGRIPNDMLANPAAVQVAVDGRTVTLKGAVKNEEEARLVEGLVRLTPGVFGIKNELTFVK